MTIRLALTLAAGMLLTAAAVRWTARACPVCAACAPVPAAHAGRQYAGVR